MKLNAPRVEAIGNHQPLAICSHPPDELLDAFGCRCEFVEVARADRRLAKR